jgi:hypothetical protein
VQRNFLKNIEKSSNILFGYFIFIIFKVLNIYCWTHNVSRRKPKLFLYERKKKVS